jgi:hypothetical protein
MANTVASLDKAMEYVQEKKLLDLKPASSIVYELAPMKEADRIGRKYLAPVCLSYELGFTFGDGTAFAYNDDVAGIYEEIEIDPNPVVLKSRLSIEAADRLDSGKAVMSHVVLRSSQMKQSLLKMAEIEMIHGRVGVGVISGDPSVNTTPNPDQASIIFTAASWAPGIWSGMNGALLEVRSTGGTKRNANGDLTLVSVDYDNKTIVVSGDNTDLTALADTDLVYFKGAYSNGQYGLKYQLDTSGTVFGIDNSVYDLWKASEVAVGGNLTMAKVLQGVAKARARGGLDEECILLVSDVTYEKLNADEAALKMFDQSYRKEAAENGFKGIKYHTQSVSVEILAHPMFKEGEAMLFARKGLKRIGSTDITFKRADGKEGFWETLESVHAYQLVGRYSFQILLSEPAKAVLFTGITNT